MHEPDYWTRCADAMEMSIEGNRLITEEIVGFAGNCWHRVVRSWDGLIHGHRHHRHLPRA